MEQDKLFKDYLEGQSVDELIEEGVCDDMQENHSRFQKKWPAISVTNEWFSGIDELSDFKGKRVLATIGSTDFILSALHYN
ncbi:hypothetical protein KY328_00295, partial [Candidatus Woesearchaeota archaeon]|nr:hypothetical protein [Candidatus Woesearchaeota archaeon]